MADRTLGFKVTDEVHEGFNGTRTT